MIPRRYFVTIATLIPILAVYLYVACRAWKTAGASGTRPGLRKSLVLIAGGLVLFSILTEFHTWLWIPRRLTAGAQGLVNLCGLVGAATLGIWLIVRLAGSRLPPSFHAERRIALKTIAGAAIAAPAGIAGFAVFVERTDFETCETDILIPDLPPELEGLRLLQLSDIHLGAYLSVNTLAKVIDQANELQSDLAFVTGDLISSRGDPLDACLQQLARLKVNGPRFGCLGNHEIYARSVEQTVDGGARVGIEFLRNQSRVIQRGGATLNIAGVDYQPIGRRSKYLRSGASMIVPGACNLLLSHNPDVFPVAAAQGYDLTLAGHTHGGQVTGEILSPALNPARFLTPFVRGLYREGDRSCYVTRGIGTLGVPARLGARPEITFLTLRRGKATAGSGTPVSRRS